MHTKCTSGARKVPAKIGLCTPITSIKYDVHAKIFSRSAILYRHIVLDIHFQWIFKVCPVKFTVYPVSFGRSSDVWERVMYSGLKPPVVPRYFFHVRKYISWVLLWPEFRLSLSGGWGLGWRRGGRKSHQTFLAISLPMINDPVPLDGLQSLQGQLSIPYNIIYS